MTHILQADHATWLAVTGNDNPDAQGVCSPVLTVPYDTDVLYMDVTIFDSTIANPSHPGEQIQYWLNNADTSKPGNRGTTQYEFESDFYFQHHSSSDPFTTALGVQLHKGSDTWHAGDQFVILWLFYQTDHNAICGLKSIRIY